MTPGQRTHGLSADLTPDFPSDDGGASSKRDQDGDRNPYPGLRSFEAGDSELFFGREDETDELRRRLRASRFLAVVGGSGSGKSSLVRCGLLPSLHAGLMAGGVDDWRVAVMRPGDDPIGALAAALDQPGVLRGGADAALDTPVDPHADTRRTMLAAHLRDSSLGLAQAVAQAALPAGARLLLLVDQFEELFRYRRLRPPGPHGDDAAAFVQLLLQAARSGAGQVYVVLTMRAEFMGDCMALAGLAEAINAGQYLIPRMSRDAMRRAIGAPATVRGASIAPRLMVRLLNEVGDELDRLPVLQHALMRTWQAWAADHAAAEPLDVRHYEAIGTTREALARHAEEAWRALGSPAAQALAQRLWQALTETTDEGRGIRRPTTLASLQAICAAPPAELVHVIEVFRGAGRGMLQPPAGVALDAGAVVDITHESLMRLWPRLAEWTRQEARARDIYRRVLASARQHAAGEAGLWRPPELTLGLRWLAETRPNAAWAAWAGDAAAWPLALGFLQRSRRARHLRNGGATGAVVAAVALVIGGLAYDGRQKAELAEARARELDARQREVLALTDQVQRLKAAQAQDSAGREQDLAQVQELRAQHAALTARVGALDLQRVALLGGIAKTRETNRGLEQELGLLGVEQRVLDEQAGGLRQQRDRNETRLGQLARSIQGLTPVPAILAGEVAALSQRIDELARVRDRLQALIQALHHCYLEMHLANADLVSPPWPEPDPQAQPTWVPADRPALQEPASADALRRQVEALARELAALLAERARLQDEAAFLAKANALLRGQVGALERELQLLGAQQAYWNEVQARLKEDVGTARSARDTARATVAALHKTLAQQRQRLDELQARHAALESGTVDESSRIASHRRRIAALQAGIDQDAAELRPLVQRLADAGRQSTLAPDLAAMLAVLAYRLTPDQPDDAAHPEVYNSLWQVLHRLDAPAALALVAPTGAGTGTSGRTKLATTSSLVMAQGLCRRAGRSLTETEWQQHLPRSACYSPTLADACAHLPVSPGGSSRPAGQAIPASSAP